MVMKHALGTMTVVGALMAVPAGADVTITQTVAGKVGPMAMDGTSVMQLKGSRMRTDSKVSQRDISTIIDLDKRQFVTLNHEKKEAEITDMGTVAKSMAQFTAGDISVSMTPTGNKKEVMGLACEEYTITIKVPFQAPPQGGAPAGTPAMMITMDGPACLSKTAPGRADYAAFYAAAAEKGLFITDPRQAKASPGQAKGMVEMYRELAKAGMPLASDLTIGFEGGGPLGGMMSKMGSTKLTSTVTKIATDAVADAVFEIPAGYKVKENK